MKNKQEKTNKASAEVRFGARVEKRALTEAELDQISGGLRRPCTAICF